MGIRVPVWYSFGQIGLEMILAILIKDSLRTYKHFFLSEP